MMISPDQKPIETGLGAKPEPKEIMAGIDLTGERVVVTGGYSGIGLETTRALAKAGAEVVIPVRSPDKAKTALGEIEGKLVVRDMDLADLASVRQFAQSLIQDDKPIKRLINNAGIMACPETRTAHGWEAQFATNHLGHFVLTQALMPLIQKAGGARIVCLSSLAHKRSAIRWDDTHFKNEPYEKWEAYGQAKTANALFAVELDRRYQGDGVRAFAVHPGGIFTPLQRHLPKEEMVALGWIDKDGNVPDMVKALFKTPPQGAATTLWAATSEQLTGLGGVYCEDCNIAQLADEASPRYFHVMPHAVDREAAERLWSVSEQMVNDV